MKKTILMLGAQGVLGNFTANSLKAAGYNVFRGGRRPDNATDFRLVDLDRLETLTAALDGVDLVVSSIEDPEVRAEREVMRHGGILLSQATLPASARRLLEAEAAKGVKGTVVLNSGLSGVAALVIKELLENFPDADEVEFAYIVSTAASSGLTGTRYAHRLLTEQSGLRIVQREFTAPRGVRPCFDLSDNDEVWISPSVVGNRKVHAFLAIAEKGLSLFLRGLNRTGLLARLPEGLLTAGVKMKPAPIELTREPIRARLAVYKNGTPLAACGVDAEGDYNSTVQSTTLFAMSLLQLADTGGARTGLFGVEDVFHLKDLRPALDTYRVFVQPMAA